MRMTYCSNSVPSGSPTEAMLSRMNGFSSTRRSPKFFHFVDSNSLSLTLPTLPGRARQADRRRGRGRRDSQPRSPSTRVSARWWILPGMARFEDQDLTDAEFRECDLTRARLIGVVMQDAVIDGLVSNLVVNGVEVTSYVEAELDRRHPVRLLIRSADPADLRQAF